MRRLFFSEGLIYYGFIFALIVASFYIASKYIEPAPPRHLTLAAGSEQGAYYHYALTYKKLLADADLEVKILPSEGSLENLRLLMNGKADFAFVQSGIAAAFEEDEIRSLGSLGALYFEPLWIFTRLGEAQGSLRDMAGKRLAVGGIGSGTRAITMQVLSASGIDKTDAYFLNLGGEDAFLALQEGQVDAVFIAGGISSPLIEKFLRHPAFDLYSLERAVAYDKRYPFLTHLSLPEGVVDLEQDIPSVQKELIASAALLVAGPSSHQTLRSLLVHKSQMIHGGELPYLQHVDFPSSSYSDIPLAEEAQRYYEFGPTFLQRYVPFWVADLLDRLKVMLIPLLTILLPLTKIAPFTYRWRIRRKIFKWYGKLQEIEKEYLPENEDKFSGSRSSKSAVPAAENHHKSDSLLAEDGMLGNHSTTDQAGTQAPDSAHSDGLEDNPDDDRRHKEVLKRLNKMDREVRKTHVPLSYMDDLYELRIHISLIQEKLREQFMI